MPVIDVDLAYLLCFAGGVACGAAFILYLISFDEGPTCRGMLIVLLSTILMAGGVALTVFVTRGAFGG